ncbi:spore maturation protein [Flaviaesturariibacter flavus]|uniref:Spore maturation protein n=1 Tax=Flaviaesturariibacter flavus TaxID=2502780 RepID=A0A4R1BNC1_9BACT|nr:spore maturation protein [Flaviaesturariibacter flavus]TCJ19100.1 spore maturation protein [Flaviaesturariibacter flavus]
MALSRIWSAFIIIAVVVAGFRAIVGDSTIFNRMVTGKSSDAYDSVAYVTVGSPATQNLSPRYFDLLREYGYTRRDSAHKATVLLTDNPKADSVRLLQAQNRELKVYTYTGVQSKLERKVDGIVETAKSAVLTIILPLVGVMALFMGLLSIAERAGGIRVLSRIIGPFFSRVFPGIPKGHPAVGHMMMNFSANLLNLDNAATPFGLKAMESLQELNEDKTRASDAQIMFLCLHASGLTLIPTTIIAFRAGLGAKTPTDIFIPCMIATFCATMAALFLVAFRQRINLFQPVILAWVGGLSLLITALVLYVHGLDQKSADTFSGLLSNGIILLLFLVVVLGGLYKKIDVFDAFVEGAKGGFDIAIRIIPYIVGMLVAISMLRTSGCFDLLINGMKNLFAALGTDTRFVDGLPTALIKPLSGSGARGMMLDTMKTFGPDSFAGRLACILQGSSDTTFYVVAVYFGSVGIRNSRYAVGLMLLADLVGIVASILLCYLFFG